jgi:hypothetical protein
MDGLNNILNMRYKNRYAKTLNGGNDLISTRMVRSHMRDSCESPGVDFRGPRKPAKRRRNDRLNSEFKPSGSKSGHDQRNEPKLWACFGDSINSAKDWPIEVFFTSGGTRSRT